MGREEISLDVIKEIISKAIENGGATIDLSRGAIATDIDGWLFPEFPSKTRIYLQTSKLSTQVEHFIVENEALFEQTGRFLGLWVNPQSQELYVDICCVVKDKKAALERAKAINEKSSRKILAMYNLKFDETILVE